MVLGAEQSLQHGVRIVNIPYEIQEAWMRPDGGNGMVFCSEPDGLAGTSLEFEIETHDGRDWKIAEVVMIEPTHGKKPRKTFLTGYLKKDAIFYYSETLRDEIGYFVAAEYVSPEREVEAA